MEKILQLQQRLKRKDKNIFLDAVEEKLTEYGYEFERIRLGRIVKSVNLETKSSQPDYIFMAHYDTPTRLPSWILWLMKFCGQNNQFLMIGLIALLFFVFFAIVELAPALFSIEAEMISIIIIGLAYIILIISFIPVLIPNKNNFDDNTSGVIALLSLAKKCKEQGIENVKFVFVDTEEIGLFGSRAHRRYLEREKLISRNCKVISLDCVGAGDFPVVIRNSKSSYAASLHNALQETFADAKSIRMIMPMSDNFSFTKYGAINISFMNKAIIPTGYYIPNIHSAKDDKVDLDKIEKLTDTLAGYILAH